MHDMSLGPPVDEGEYTGPRLDGEPLHNGNCEDGVYGCRKCNAAAAVLTTEQLEAIGWPTTGHCDWCKKEVPTQDMCGLRPWDEPSCYYEVCSSCKAKHDKDYDEAFSDEDEYEDEPNYIDPCEVCNADEAACDVCCHKFVD